MAKKIKFFDKEEQKLRESIQKGDYIPSRKSAEDMKKIEQFAKAHKAKKLISLRVSENDLLALQAKAIDKGIPYQTYINMLIHQDIML
jgi:predicted DNA binding CopG/RHH family protein